MSTEAHPQAEPPAPSLPATPLAVAEGVPVERWSVIWGEVTSVIGRSWQWLGALGMVGGLFADVINPALKAAPQLTWIALAISLFFFFVALANVSAARWCGLLCSVFLFLFLGSGTATLVQAYSDHPEEGAAAHYLPGIKGIQETLLRIEKKTDALAESVDALGVKIEDGQTKAEIENERRHREKLEAEQRTQDEIRRLSYEIGREKGLDPAKLEPLFKQIGLDPKVTIENFERKVREAIDILIQRSLKPVVPSTDGVVIDVAITEARRLLGQLDTNGAIDSLRAAREKARQDRLAQQRGEARLAEEEGDILAAAYRRDEAIVAYQTAIDLDPDRLQAYRNIGTVHATEGRRMDAMAAFERYLDAALRLSNERETSVAWNEIGDLRVAEGDRPGALDAYQKGLEIRKTLATRDPANAEWQRDLSISWERIGDLRVAEGDRPGALDAYQEGLEIAKTLAARDPANAKWQRDLSVSWEKIGDLRVAGGDRPGALDAYQKGLEIRKTLAARDPANAKWQRDLIISNVKLAQMGDDSVSRYSEALRIAQELQSSGRLAPVDAWMVEDLARRLAAAKAARP